MGRKRRKQKVSGAIRSPASTQRQRKWLLAGIVVLVSVCVVGIVVSQLQDKDVATASPPAPGQQSAGQSTDGPPRNALSQTERQKLVGSWRRADANYVLEINRIAPDGQK